MRILIAALLLATGCASSDGLVDERTLSCEPGQDVEVGVALDTPRLALEGTDDRLTMSIEVANNGHSDIEVKAIRIEPGDPSQQRYTIDRSYRKFDKVIASGEDETFELPIAGRSLMEHTNTQRLTSETMDVSVHVYLANGDTYACSFRLPSPR